MMQSNAGKQNFAEAYKNYRYEPVSTDDPGSPGGQKKQRTPSEMLARRVFGPASPRGAPMSPARQRKGADGPPGMSPRAGEYSGYSLIRSDLEEDYSYKQAVPEVPKSMGAMRQRTVQVFGERQDAAEGSQASSSMVWVESKWFGGLSGLVIFSNAIIIGLETDIDTPLWFYVEQALLCFFVFELVMRLMHHGLSRFFRHEDEWIWNFFDFSIVMSGVFDQWMMPCLQSIGLFSVDEKGGKMSVFFMLMRMLRLLRIVRLFRLVKIVRPLYELAQGVLEALQGMFWVLVFMVMTLYSVAILCTRLIGHGDILTEEMKEDADIQKIQGMFTRVDESMFTLFGTMSSWSLLKFVPLFEEMPILRPMFVLFYVYSAWALLAVMTGVVSENMIAIREQMEKEDEAREEMRKTMITKTLYELFREADADKSGTISKGEFDAMLRNKDLMRKITKNTHLKAQDLQDLFEWLDYDGGGTITIDEFMKGFKWVNEPLRAKSLVKLQERMMLDLKSLEAGVSETVQKRVAEVQALVTAPLRKVHAITEQMQTLDVHFSDIRQGLRTQADSLPTPQELRDVEARLSGKMALVFARLDEIEQEARDAEAGGWMRGRT